VTHHHRKRRLLDYERRGEPLAPPPVFRRRLIESGSVAFGVIAVSLMIGVAGYHWVGGLKNWVDCLYNASMILGGMGPVSEMTSDRAKVFASFYALYSGVVLLACVGLLLSPVLHRLLHRFHVETDEDARS
jgi:hypothetical protein